MQDHDRIRLTLELEPASAERRFCVIVREQGQSEQLVFDSALDFVGWLEARGGPPESSGLR